MNAFSYIKLFSLNGKQIPMNLILDSDFWINTKIQETFIIMTLNIFTHPFRYLSTSDTHAACVCKQIYIVI